MQKLSLRSGCSILIAVFGTILPLSAAQAATQEGMDNEEAWSSALQADASPTFYPDELRSEPKGTQGPLRTDMIDDTANSQNQPDEPDCCWPKNVDD